MDKTTEPRMHADFPALPLVSLVTDEWIAWAKDRLSERDALQARVAAIEQLVVTANRQTRQIEAMRAADIAENAHLKECLANTQARVAALEGALREIERWNEFPPSGKRWEQSGNPMSYGAAYGSNGEREYMRGVARDALAPAATRDRRRHYERGSAMKECEAGHAGISILIGDQAFVVCARCGKELWALHSASKAE